MPYALHFDSRLGARAAGGGRTCTCMQLVIGGGRGGMQRSEETDRLVLNLAARVSRGVRLPRRRTRVVGELPENAAHIPIPSSPSLKKNGRNKRDAHVSSAECNDFGQSGRLSPMKLWFQWRGATDGALQPPPYLLSLTKLDSAKVWPQSVLPEISETYMICA